MEGMWKTFEFYQECENAASLLLGCTRFAMTHSAWQMEKTTSFRSHVADAILVGAGAVCYANEMTVLRCCTSDPVAIPSNRLHSHNYSTDVCHTYCSIFDNAIAAAAAAAVGHNNELFLFRLNG